MKEITSYEQFKEVINSETPVIIKFGAPWCGPCKQIEPVLEKVSIAGYDVYKINVDNVPEPAMDFGVMSVPTTFSFGGGKALRRMVGTGSFDEIILLVEGMNISE